MREVDISDLAKRGIHMKHVPKEAALAFEETDTKLGLSFEEIEKQKKEAKRKKRHAYEVGKKGIDMDELGKQQVEKFCAKYPDFVSTSNPTS